MLEVAEREVMESSVVCVSRIVRACESGSVQEARDTGSGLVGTFGCL